MEVSPLLEALGLHPAIDQHLPVPEEGSLQRLQLIGSLQKGRRLLEFSPGARPEVGVHLFPVVQTEGHEVPRV